MKCQVVYVAGRFRGPTEWDIAQNVRRAEEAGLAVAKLGAMPLIPQANTARFNGLLTDEFWLRGTLELLKRCDALYVHGIDDLNTSQGTRGEWEYAQRNGIPTFISLADLERWLRDAEAASGDEDPAQNAGDGAW